MKTLKLIGLAFEAAWLAVCSAWSHARSPLRIVCATCKKALGGNPCSADVSHGICAPCYFRTLRPLLLVALLAFPLAGCNTLKRDFLGEKHEEPKFDTSPYAQIIAGPVTKGEVTVTRTMAFPPARVTAFWSQYRPRSRNGQIEISCAPIGPESEIEQFPAVQPGRAWPYAVVSVDGLEVTVQFLGMGNDNGCWAFRSNPAIAGSSHDLY